MKNNICTSHLQKRVVAGRRRLGWGLCLCTLLLPGGLRAHDGGSEPLGRPVHAVRVQDEAPRIDGVLDDAVWRDAPVFSGFTQRDPDEGKAATESTTVQFAYDDESLYIGVVAYEREPEKIVARLCRRDHQTESDRVQVMIDAHHDHQTARWFRINAAGSVDDGYISNDGDGWDAWDRSWDGVWEARSARHAHGWSVEFKIPYHVLRFSPGEEYTWGINVDRYISHKKEQVFWVMVPRKKNGWPSNFAHLEGIEGIAPPKSLELLPYSVGRSTFAGGDGEARDLFGNLGGNLRYGLTSGISLNAAINPDFGQVEADPAQLNLSVFEAFQVNDLGFQWRNDNYSPWLWLQVRKDEPWGWFRSNSLNFNRWGRWNFDGVTLEDGVNINTWHQLKNYWWIGGEFSHNFRARDDRDTRGGPLIVGPASTEYEVEISSDGRGNVSGWAWFEWGSNSAGSNWREFGSGLKVRTRFNIELSLRPHYNWNFNHAQWVENVDVDQDGEDDHFIYGELSSKTLDLTTRLNLIFTRDLSLEFYLQPFLTVGDYDHFKELARPNSYEFTPHSAPQDNPDFRRRSLQSNMVLRWEYHPGSTVFLVWGQSRDHESEDPAFRAVQNLGSSFVDEGSNIFLIKLNYWVGI